MQPVLITLTRHILQSQAAHPGATGEFSALMAQIGLVGKMIAYDLRRAGLINVLGTTGATNVQGETVTKLDAIANDVFLKVFQYSGLVSALASEEMDKPVQLPENWPHGKYILLFDPLDGSSNTDVNMPLGSIFSILRHEGTGLPSEQEMICKGATQVAAGYLLYGSSTLLVFTAGHGVHGFTLDPGVGEYYRSHENIQIPAKGQVYAVNEGNAQKWPAGTRNFLEYLKARDQATGRPYAARYSGCLVADVHRVLLGGGLYLYPAEMDKPQGKLRLLYEANPLAMIVEQAGGKASTGTQRILDVVPTTLHQRVPLVIGSKDDVTLAEEFMRGVR
ncbi:MAG: class 1 fructose-bisphosphatase [Nitrospira sp.]